MNLFRFFQPAASAPMARERLQILLEYPIGVSNGNRSFRGCTETLVVLS
jgi:hypothetical protein